MSFDINNAYEVGPDGILISTNDGTLLHAIAAGDLSPVGSQAPIGSRYFQTNGKTWEKFGALDTQWRELVSVPAQSIAERSIERVLENPGQTGNKWLLYQNKTTDVVPVFFGLNADLIGCVYTNTVDSSDCDIEVYKNGLTATELVHTFEIRLKRKYYSVQLAPLASFDIGDNLSVFCRDQGNNPSNVVLNLLFRVRDDTVGTGGSAT